jgi:twitching motility protein PilU
MMEWDPILKGLLDHMLKVDASDLYITADSAPVFRISGVGHAGRATLPADRIDAMAQSIMTEAQNNEFRDKLEMNLALANDSGGRFRANIFRQRGATGMVFRLVRTEIKTLDELKLPPVLADIMHSKRGLVLLVGATGSGKSTTLAAMIDHRNRSESGHIITVEDPIEFMHSHQKCVVTQREVGIDTRSYHEALKNTLRQAPDVILIGEIRDAETMEHAIAFAETGHLCLSTLHANNANQAIERILNFFPPSRHHEIKLQLSLNLRGIVSQRLVRAEGGGRAAALEILIDTPRVKDLIKRGEIEAIKDAMEQGGQEGCQTFDGALYDLVAAGRISDADALRAADSPNNLRLRLDRLRQVGAEDENVLRLVERPKLKAVRA